MDVNGDISAFHILLETEMGEQDPRIIDPTDHFLISAAVATSTCACHKFTLQERKNSSTTMLRANFYKTELQHLYNHLPSRGHIRRTGEGLCSFGRLPLYSSCSRKSMFCDLQVARCIFIWWRIAPGSSWWIVASGRLMPQLRNISFHGLFRHASCALQCWHAGREFRMFACHFPNP